MGRSMGEGVYTLGNSRSSGEEHNSPTELLRAKRPPRRRIAGAPGGPVYALWENEQGSHFGVRLQAFDPQGNKWPEVTVTDNAGCCLALGTTTGSNAIVAWSDGTPGYAADSCRVQVFDQGDGHALWRPGGVAILGMALNALSDWAGGVFVQSILPPNYTANVMHLDANGQVYPGWPSAGVELTSTTCPSAYPSPGMAPDGVGGVLVWGGCSPSGLSVHRLTADGSLAPGWGLRESCQGFPPALRKASARILGAGPTSSGLLLSAIAWATTCSGFTCLLTAQESASHPAHDCLRPSSPYP